MTINIFVTGGNGYAGNRFVSKILNATGDIYLNSVVRNIIPKQELRNLNEITADLIAIDKYKLALVGSDYVVWFAALRKHFANFDRLYENNVLPIKNSLSALQYSKRLKKIIYISTISTMDNTPHTPNPINIDISNTPTTAYGRTKLMAEEAIKESGLPYLIIRLPFLYGSKYPNYGHLWFWKLLISFHFSRRIYFSGRVSLLHINDLANILKYIIFEEFLINKNETFVIGDGKNYLVNNILDTLQIIFDLGVVKRDIESKIILEKIHKIMPLSSWRYWSRLLFDEHYFTSVPTRCALLDNYNYIRLYDGMYETYKV